MKKLIIISMALAIAACASVTEQVIPVATQETLELGNALIIVERKKEDNASAHQVEITDNGKMIGQLGVGVGSRHRRQYHQLVWQRPAGEMAIKLTPKSMVKDYPPIVKNVEAGQTYYFEVGFKFSKYSLILTEK